MNPFNSLRAYGFSLDESGKPKTDSAGQFFSNLAESLLGKYAGTNRTGAEEQATQTNIEEAQKQRDWLAQMDNTRFQRGVADAQAAGLNSALLFGNVAASTPSGSSAASAAPGSASIADLMAAVMLPAQLRRLNAETANIEANTANTREITKINAVAAKFKAEYSETELRKFNAEISELVSRSGLNQSNQNYVDSQTTAQETVNKYLDERQNAELDKLAHESKNLSASAAKSLADATFTTIQANYAREHKVLMSNSDMLNVATYICDILGIDKNNAKSRARSAFGIIRSANDAIDKGIQGLSDKAEELWKDFKDNFTDLE